MTLTAPCEVVPPPTKRSGGPKTEEGKARSRMNALKHGLTGDPITFAEGRPEEYEARLNAWRGSFRIEGEYDEYAFRVMVAESLRGEHCKRISIVLRDEYARRADESWEYDRELAAREVAENLSRKPAITRAKLISNKYGCQILIEMWESLLGVLEADGDWDDSQKQLALDLMGVDPRVRSGFLLFKPGAPDADRKLLDARAEFVAVELAKLREHAGETLDLQDAAEIECARAGVFFNEPKMLATLRRYEKDCARRQQQMYRQLGGRARAPRSESARDPQPRKVAPRIPEPVRRDPNAKPTVDAAAGLARLIQNTIEPKAKPPIPALKPGEVDVESKPIDRSHFDEIVNKAFAPAGPKPSFAGSIVSTCMRR